MKRFFTFAFFWFISLIVFAQNSSKPSDFVTVTVKIVDYMDETVFLDAPLSISDSTGDKIMNFKTELGKEFYQKIGEGHYRIFLEKGNKYKATAAAITIDCELDYSESSEEIDLSNIRGGDNINVIIRMSGGGGDQFDNVNFNTNKPTSGRKKHLMEAIQQIPKSIETCEGVLAFLEDYPEGTVEISAHCDSTEKNPEKLAKWRALAIRHYLVQKGIQPERLKIEFFGSSSPMVPNDSANNRALNRRVMFEIPRPCEEE